jgi:hypothetical protein
MIISHVVYEKEGIQTGVDIVIGTSTGLKEVTIAFATGQAMVEKTNVFGEREPFYITILAAMVKTVEKEYMNEMS